MKGYWKDPEKTSEAITEGQWYKTGCVQTQLSGSLERAEGFGTKFGVINFSLQ